MGVKVLTGEDWNAVLYDCWRAAGSEAVVYFFALLCIGMFVVLNLFLAILLSNFSGDSLDAEGAGGGSETGGGQEGRESQEKAEEAGGGVDRFEVFDSSSSDSDGFEKKKQGGPRIHSFGSGGEDGWDGYQSSGDDREASLVREGAQARQVQQQQWEEEEAAAEEDLPHAKDGDNGGGSPGDSRLSKWLHASAEAAAAAKARRIPSDHSRALARVLCEIFCVLACCLHAGRGCVRACVRMCARVCIF